MSTIPRRALVALPAVPLVLWLAAVGCKTAERADDGTTPSAAPSASAAPTAATAEPSQTAAPPPHPTVVTPLPRPDGGAPTDAGAAVDAGKPAATDAGAASAKFKACFEKCQAALTGCLTPVIPDGGGRLPLPPAPATCQAAFATCQAACTP